MKKFFATYIIDTNPNSGAFVMPVETHIVRDSNNNVILNDLFDDMFDYCKSLIDLDIQQYPDDYVRICLTENSLMLLDNDDYQVMRYDIHEIKL